MSRIVAAIVLGLTLVVATIAPAHAAPVPAPPTSSVPTCTDRVSRYVIPGTDGVAYDVQELGETLALDVAPGTYVIEGNGAPTYRTVNVTARDRTDDTQLGSWTLTTYLPTSCPVESVPTADVGGRCRYWTAFMNVLPTDPSWQNPSYSHFVVEVDGKVFRELSMDLRGILPAGVGGQFKRNGKKHTVKVFGNGVLLDWKTYRCGKRRH